MTRVKTIISTHSFRGGTGKSNVTANLAVLAARSGRRVAIIDTDIQSPGVHVLFSLAPDAQRRTLNDYLWGRCRLPEAACDVTEAALGNAEDPAGPSRLFLVPSSMNSDDISRIVAEGYDVGRLNDGIQELMRDPRLNLDCLFIDTHPGVNEETLLSIAISHVLILILRPDNQDFQGTAVAVELARQLEVPAMYLILNKVPPGTDHAALRERVGALYDTPVLGVLPLNSEVARVASGGIFTNRYPDHPFSLELQSVVQTLFPAAVKAPC